jgi:hypothetical protein
MRTRRLPASLATVLLALALTALATGPAPAAPSVPTLIGIRAAHHPGFDRVVFDFRGGLPASRRVSYVDQLTGDPSGLPVRIAGRAVLQVRLESAQAHDATGQTATARQAFALPNVMTVVRAGDSEGVTTYGIGLEKRTSVQVFTLTSPDRVVVDVHAAFATVSRKVWFLNRPRFLANQPPFFTSVLRPVQPLSPARGVMDRLLAGPLPGEQANGLRLVRSQATGFADLAVADGVARLRLTGGCDSGGSTVTVAGEIRPTLRQFGTVDWVKILDPAGATESPTGHTDSIPVCLEP